MDLVHPAALWLLLLIPLLLLARRRTARVQVQVANLPLWSAAAPSQTTGSPKPHRDWLLVLQALFVAALVLALARPMLWLQQRHIALIVDVSASMGARSSGTTRLDEAKERAVALLRELPGRTRVHLIAAHASAEDRGDFAASDAGLVRGITSLSQTDAAGDMAGALRQAEAGDPAMVYIFSDARLPAEPAAARARRFWSIAGGTADNAAITSISYARPNGHPRDAEVLVSLHNYGTADVATDLTLTHAGTLVARDRVTIPARQGSVRVMTIPNAAGIVTAALQLTDALAADDRRSLVIPPADPLRVRLVNGGFFLDKALNALPGVRVLRQGNGSSPPDNEPVDVIVCEGCRDLPAGTAGVLMIPPAPGVANDVSPMRRTPTEHAVSEALILNGVLAAPRAASGTIRNGVILASIGTAAAVIASADGGRRVVELAADPEGGTLPLDPAFPVLIANAVRWLSAIDRAATGLVAGQPAPWSGASIATTSKAGIQQLQIDGRQQFVAINSAIEESDLSAPAGGQDDDLTKLPPARVLQTDVSRLLLLLALGFLAAEWALRRRRLGYAARRIVLVRGTLAAALILGIAGIRFPGGEASVSAMILLDRSDSMASIQPAAVARARTLAAGMRGGDRAGVVSFGDTAEIERRPDKSSPTVAERGSSPAAAGTNIEQALRVARGILPRDGSRRLVLVSDGRQTAGDALKEASAAAAEGVRLDVAIPEVPPDSGRVVPLIRVAAPSVVAAGEPFEVAAAVDALPGTRGTVVLTREGAPSESAAIIVPATGSARAAFQVWESESGVHTYRVGFNPAAGDFSGAVDDSGTAGAVVVVAGERRLLHVGGAGDLLDSELRRRGFRIDRTSPAGLARTPAALAAYDAIVLDDVPGDELGAEQSAALTRYVEDLAGGVLVLGSPRSLDAGITENSQLAALLPVDLKPRAGRRAPRVSIVIVFDKSGSMNEIVDGAPRIDYARQAVQRVLESVPPTDLVGVIAFDATAVSVAPLQAGHVPEAIGNRLRTVQPAGSTAIAPALELASAWLQGPETAGSATRHILLLSDGHTSAEDAARAQAAVQSRGIEVSVVALGEGSDRGFLGALASRTGGRSYFPIDVRQLPLLLAREATRVAGGRVINEAFTPRVMQHPAVAGLNTDAMPRLGGYVVSAAKPSAEVALRSHLDDPILAMTRTGLGKVAVYTADLNAPWSAALRGWSGVGPLFTQTVRWVSRQTRDESLSAHLDATADGAHIVVEAETPQGGHFDPLDVSAVVRAPDGTARTITLAPAAPGRYEASVTLKEPGPHVIAVAATSPGGAFEANLVRGFFRSADWESRQIGVDREALIQLARTGGGHVLTGAETPFTLARDRASRDGVPWIAGAALLIFFADLLTPLIAGVAARAHRRREARARQDAA